MDILATTITQFLVDLTLPFMRVVGMFTAMVGFSARNVNPRVRVMLAVFVTLLVMPMMEPIPITQLLSVGSFLLIIQQLLIGIAIGFLSSLMLNTFVLAGQILAMQTGLGFASIVDPVNGINVPAVGQFYLILATLLFWAMDCHLIMLQMIAASFEAFPVGSGWFTGEQFREIAHWGSYMFLAAVTMSLAPIMSLLVVNLSFGVMTKAAPQLNIFSLGFAIAQKVGFVVMWVTIGNFIYHFESQWDRAQLLMCQLLRVCPP
ncbi:Flagellar biosynthetic protein FliR [Saliniradius amylolyticus]|uniref:Flagellar biosynthetic protein FliR n=1 Tax=Saliniradius amylolyticus TaxID=2183582 RepID=A0A2S2E4G7_9ALTE|nr:flagellar biosynthetic protein FliR [Saliniradius amylolyticus]AWL12551.1 Flagellar biosynthetic protein FliR [Saliniradius amylolyticus]